MSLEPGDLIPQNLILFPQPVIQLFDLRYPLQRRNKLQLKLGESERLLCVESLKLRDAERLPSVDSLKLRDAEVCAVGADLPIEISPRGASSKIRHSAATSFGEVTAEF